MHDSRPIEADNHASTALACTPDPLTALLAQLEPLAHRQRTTAGLGLATQAYAAALASSARRWAGAPPEALQQFAQYLRSNEAALRQTAARLLAAADNLHHAALIGAPSVTPPAGPLTPEESAALGPHWWASEVTGCSLFFRSIRDGDVLLVRPVDGAPTFGSVVTAGAVDGQGVRRQVVKVWLCDGLHEWLQSEGAGVLGGPYTGTTPADTAGGFQLHGRVAFVDSLLGIPPNRQWGRSPIRPRPPKPAAANLRGDELVLPPIPDGLAAVTDVGALRQELAVLVAEYAAAHVGQVGKLYGLNSPLRHPSPEREAYQAWGRQTSDAICAFYDRLHILGAPLRVTAGGRP